MFKANELFSNMRLMTVFWECVFVLAWACLPALSFIVSNKMHKRTRWGGGINGDGDHTQCDSRLEAAHKKDKRKICRQVKWMIFWEWLHKKILWFMSVSDSQPRMMTKLLFLIVFFNFFCCYYCSPHKYFLSQYEWVFTPLQLRRSLKKY